MAQERCSLVCCRLAGLAPVPLIASCSSVSHLAATRLPNFSTATYGSRVEASARNAAECTTPHHTPAHDHYCAAGQHLSPALVAAVACIPRHCGRQVLGSTVKMSCDSPADAEGWHPVADGLTVNDISPPSECSSFNDSSDAAAIVGATQALKMAAAEHMKRTTHLIGMMLAFQTSVPQDPSRRTTSADAHQERRGKAAFPDTPHPRVSMAAASLPAHATLPVATFVAGNRHVEASRMPLLSADAGSPSTQSDSKRRHQSHPLALANALSLEPGQLLENPTSHPTVQAPGPASQVSGKAPPNQATMHDPLPEPQPVLAQAACAGPSLHRAPLHEPPLPQQAQPHAPTDEQPVPPQKNIHQDQDLPEPELQQEPTPQSCFVPAAYAVRTAGSGDPLPALFSELVGKGPRLDSHEEAALLSTLTVSLCEAGLRRAFNGEGVPCVPSAEVSPPCRQDLSFPQHDGQLAEVSPQRQPSEVSPPAEHMPVGADKDMYVVTDGFAAAAGSAACQHASDSAGQWHSVGNIVWRAQTVDDGPGRDPEHVQTLASLASQTQPSEHLVKDCHPAANIRLSN